MTERPIQDAHRTQMNAFAEILDEILNGTNRPRRVGFALLVFEFGKTEGGRVNYISNAQRAEMLTAMREYIARAEGRAVDASETRQ
ncbi:hypothetical protein [Salinarimonas sp.]|uniref:hypothetical protein n=1 Tax=Salinarimonas sp. TaxID=2766526 RepID=UPI00391AB5DD